MEKIDISVIIPTFKPKGYLWECLDSLCKQEFQYERFEIIVILNGEKHPYEEHIIKFIKTHPKHSFIYLYSEVLGVSNARNIGLENAKGEFIAFIDDDDYVSPSYLQELYAKSNKDTIGLVYPYAFNDGESKIQLEYSITKEYERCFRKGKQSYLKPKKFFSGPCMKLIHRNIIGNRRFDLRFKNGEDSLFMFLISDKMKTVDFTSKDAIYYRRFRENSATTSLRPLGEMLDNCWQRLGENTKIYFSDIRHYNFYRYCMTVLGLCHILLSEIILVRLKMRNKGV